MSTWNGLKRTPIKRKTPLRRFQKPLKRGGRIKQRSSAPHKVAAQQRYRQAVKERRAESPGCQVRGCERPSTDPHHMKGRVGPLLYDKEFLLMVCHEHHEKIEKKRKWAMEQGYSLSRSTKKETRT